MTNPFYDTYETSLGKLSGHDWNVLTSRWNHGIDYNIGKVGKRWEILSFADAHPIFKTKREAYTYAENLILAESRHRAKLAWGV